MRHFLIVAAIAATSLLAPVARAADDDILAVDYKDLPKLWTQVSGTVRGESDFPLKYRGGCARFSFIVEKNGQVSTIKMISAFPGSDFADIATRMIKRWRFEPTALNKARTPAYTEQIVVFVQPGAEKVLGSNRRAKIDKDAIAQQCMHAENAIK